MHHVPFIHRLALFIIVWVTGITLIISAPLGWAQTTSTTSDTTPPVISSVSATNITASAATIVWTTDEKADQQVEYGQTTAYGLATAVINSTLLLRRDRILPSLLSGTLYHYRVKSRDAAGNLAVSQDYTFTTTASTADTTPPVISDVTASNITQTSAYISWITNEPADTRVQYGAGLGYEFGTKIDSNLATTHSMALELPANSTFHYRALSIDAAGNATFSSDYTLTTASISPPPPPPSPTNTTSTPTSTSPTPPAPLPSPSPPPPSLSGVPVAPSGLTARRVPMSTSPYQHDLILTWTDNSPNETKYIKLYSKHVVGDWSTWNRYWGTQLNNVNATSTGFYMGTSHGTYNFRVQACNTYGCSDYSNIASFDNVYNSATGMPESGIPDTTPPSIPTGLTATPKRYFEIGVRWSASSDNTVVTGYHLYRNGMLVPVSQRTDQTEAARYTYFGDNYLSAGNIYTYSVEAFDQSGNVSARSAPVSATTPDKDTLSQTECLGQGRVWCSSPSITVAWCAPFGASCAGTSTGQSQNVPPPPPPPTTPPPSPEPAEATGVCIIYYNSVALPNTSYSDVGIGYAKMKKPGINTISGLQAACTKADYDELLSRYCEINTNILGGEQMVVTFGSNGVAADAGCGDGRVFRFGCTMMLCPSSKPVLSPAEIPVLRAACISKGKKWCVPPTGHKDPYCATVCIYDAEYQEEAKRVCLANPIAQWCASSNGAGNCTLESSETCPQTAEIISQAECGKQGRKWCASGAFSIANGWCSPPGTECLYMKSASSTAPVIYGIQPKEITRTSARIQWATDVHSNSQVEYGLSTAYGFRTKIFNELPNMVAGYHDVVLSDLSPGMVYHYRVKSSGPDGVSGVSYDRAFITLSSSTVSLPSILPPVPPVSSPLSLLESIPLVLFDDETRFLADRRAVLQDLRAIERLVKRDVIEVDAKRLKALKEKLLSLKPEEEGDASMLKYYRRQITDLQNFVPESSERELIPVDPREEVQALRQMKKDSRLFERYIATLDAKVAQIEKSGVIVDTDIKEIVATAKNIAQRVNKAKTYRDIRDIAEKIPDVGQALNDALPRLEELLRLPPIMRLVDGRIADGEKAIKQAATLAKQLKFDISDELGEMRILLDGARTTVAVVKSNGITDGLLEVLEMQAFVRVDDVLERAEHIRAVANVRQTVNRATSDVKRYEKYIRRLKATDKNKEVVNVLLGQFKEQFALLKAVSAQGLTTDTGGRVIDYLDVMTDLKIELEEVLRLSSPDPVRKRIERLFSTSGEKIKPFAVERLEQGVL